MYSIYIKVEYNGDDNDNDFDFDLFNYIKYNNDYIMNDQHNNQNDEYVFIIEKK